MEQSKTARMDQKRAEFLLYPIAAFLLAGGLNKTTTQKAFASAIDKALKITRRRIDHIGPHFDYADVIYRWNHDTRFLDRHGGPRPLRLNGANEFGTLVRATRPTLDARVVMSVLKRYGNVRKTTGGRYALVRPFFLSTRRNSLAFEPMAYFLSDASATLGRMLSSQRKENGPAPFWRMVEAIGLSNAAMREFTDFVRERSWFFLQELDEWLEARRKHRPGKRNVGNGRRVGLGLFSIYSSLAKHRDHR